MKQRLGLECTHNLDRTAEMAKDACLACLQQTLGISRMGHGTGDLEERSRLSDCIYSGQVLRTGDLQDVEFLADVSWRAEPLLTLTAWHSREDSTCQK